VIYTICNTSSVQVFLSLFSCSWLCDSYVVYTSHSQGELFLSYIIPSSRSKLPERSPGNSTYAIILLTTPAPTVLPPSRIANRVPSSRAIGAMSSTSILTLSPGITISVPSWS